MLRASLLLLLLLPLLAGCEGVFPPRACTLIGCEDGLNVELAELPATGGFVVEVLLPDGGAKVVECKQAENCYPGAFFAGVTAAEVTIRVTTAAGTRTDTVRPAYTRSRPNGRGCPPVCLQGRIEVPLPE